jgi:hypothetical protein
MKYTLYRRFSFTFLILALLTAVPTLSFGQWILGLKAGYEFNKISGSGVYGGINNKPGIDAGLVISRKLKVDFAFESGLFFNQAGMNQKFIETNKIIENNPDPTIGRTTTDSTFSYSNSLSLNYLKIPLTFRKSFSIRGSNIYPYRRKISITDIDIMFGPYVSYLMSASASYSTKLYVVKKDNNGAVTATEPETALSDPYHLTFKIGGTDTALIPLGLAQPRSSIDKGLSKIDVGITASLGLSIELSPDSKLMFGGNYSMGLLSIDKTYFNTVKLAFDGSGNPIPTTAKLDLKNSGMGFYLSWVKYLR